MKVLIIGEGGHGKDQLADFLHELTGMTKMSSSEMACGLFIFDTLAPKYGYADAWWCYADRRNHREEWYQLICEYNRDDKARLAKALLEKYDIYVGMRDDQEFAEAKGLFDLIVAVDAAERVPECDDTFKISLLAANIRIDNNGDLNDLYQEARALADYINDRR